MGQEQKGEKSGVGWGKKVTLLFPPPPRSFHCFALASLFVQPEREKTLSRGPNFVPVVRERLLRRLVRYLQKCVTHGGRKPTETSVTEFCYKSVNLSREELKNNAILLFPMQELFR